MLELQESFRVKIEIPEIIVFMVYMFKKIIMLFKFLSALLSKHGKGHDSIILCGFINYILQNPVSFSTVNGKGNF